MIELQENSPPGVEESDLYKFPHCDICEFYNPKVFDSDRSCGKCFVDYDPPVTMTVYWTYNDWKCPKFKLDRHAGFK